MKPIAKTLGTAFIVLVLGSTQILAEEASVLLEDQLMRLTGNEQYRSVEFYLDEGEVGLEITCHINRDLKAAFLLELGDEIKYLSRAIVEIHRPQSSPVVFDAFVHGINDDDIEQVWLAPDHLRSEPKRSLWFLEALVNSAEHQITLRVPSTGLRVDTTATINRAAISYVALYCGVDLFNR